MASNQIPVPNFEVMSKPKQFEPVFIWTCPKCDQKFRSEQATKYHAEKSHRALNLVLEKPVPKSQ